MPETDNTGAWLTSPETTTLQEQCSAWLAAPGVDCGLTRVAEERGAARLTRGISLYSPLYVSNICISGCTYCGFQASRENRVRRKRLGVQQVLLEAEVLAAQGIDNILLVAGDDPGLMSTPESRNGRSYLVEVLEQLAQPGRSLWLEIAPQPADVCAQLVAAGASTFVHYQETYQPTAYAELHTHGPKRDFSGRLGAAERALGAGARRVGLGALWGLADPAADLAALIQHVTRILSLFPEAGVSVSVPRLSAGPPGFTIPHPISDELFERVTTILAAILPVSVDLVLSTRETPALRERLVRFGGTLMSAGSRTSPGAYTGSAPDAGAQFGLADLRSVAEVAQSLRASGHRLAADPERARTLSDSAS